MSYINFNKVSAVDEDWVVMKLDKILKTLNSVQPGAPSEEIWKVIGNVNMSLQMLRQDLAFTEEQHPI